MATLHQDVWLDTHPRLRGLRLGPFREARLRAFVIPERGLSLDDPELGGFLDRLSDRIEVVAYELPADARGGSQDGPDVLESFEQRWGGGLPAIALGFGEGAALALGCAHLAAVRGVVALGLTTPDALRAAAALPSHPDAAEKALLVLAAPDGGRAPLAEIEGALHPWRQACLMSLPGGPGSVLRAPWPGIVAEWALALLE